MELTELEKDVLLNGIGGNEFGNGTGADAVWSSSIEYNCKITTKSQVCGVISSLVKKGLAIVSSGYAKEIDNDVRLTEAGQKILAGLKEPVKV